MPKFTEEMRGYLAPDDKDQLARIIGGIMSSLLRNEIIEQFTGGQKPVWTVTMEIHRRAKEIENAIFPVITYWDNRKED